MLIYNFLALKRTRVFTCQMITVEFILFHSFIHSFIHQCLYSPLLGPGLFFSSIIFFAQTVGLLGRVIRPSQGPYLHIGQHKHRINAHTDIHALGGIRTHDPSVRANEDSSSLRRLGHRDRLEFILTVIKAKIFRVELD
jgi:hypothetical protein